MKVCLLILTFLIVQSKAAETHQEWLNITIGGRSSHALSIGRRALKPFPGTEHSDKPAAIIPGFQFKIDPRWGEWFTNRSSLLGKEQIASESGNFMESQSLSFKVLYGEYFKAEERRVTDGKKELDEINEQKKTLLKSRQIQARFENNQALAELDRKIADLDKEIDLKKDLLEPGPKRLLSGFSSYAAENTLGGIMFDIAMRDYIEGRPATDDWKCLQRLRRYRERLAYAASLPNASEISQNEALALNQNLMAIERYLLTATFVEAQKSAAQIVNSILR